MTKESVRTKAEFILGRDGEEFVRQWLIGLGYHVVPQYLIERDGAPLLESWLRKEVLPDILAAKKGQARWVEVKTKSRATKNQKRRRWETGIPERHWQAYKRVEENTGIPGWVAFLHLEERRIYLGSLKSIGTASACAEDTGTLQAFGEPMRFFALNYFEEWWDIGTDAIIRSKSRTPAPVPPKTTKPWEWPGPPGNKQLPLL